MFLTKGKGKMLLGVVVVMSTISNLTLMNVFVVALPYSAQI